MADFNQSPAGQAPVTLTLSQLDMTLGPTTTNVSTSLSPSSVSGTSGTFDLAAPAIAAPGMYPAWRRPLRVISDD